MWLWRRCGPDGASTRFAALRHLPVQFAVMLALLVWSAQSRPDRLAGLYPLLFAAGRVGLGELATSRRLVRIGLPIWIAVWGLLLLPVGSPLRGAVCRGHADPHPPVRRVHAMAHQHADLDCPGTEGEPGR